MWAFCLRMRITRSCHMVPLRCPDHEVPRDVDCRMSSTHEAAFEGEVRAAVGIAARQALITEGL